ncbi:xyloglucan O-acetyltransferase 3-like [Euphorbia lathyris]|uniref:xyloglucan O-acetyltransferase 3-like n=1 Tax=Euphorbia lathyris TaxID=212925 RepID=UPI0033134C94
MTEFAVEYCDLFKGEWIRDLRGPQYTNRSCSSIPHSKNCFKNGRQDRDFLKWRWKPDACELPKFDPRIFFVLVRDKTMAFIGDSVARNHVESLICLLSMEEKPINTYADADNKFRTWKFPKNNFTLVVLWSKFLIHEKERVINGTDSTNFDLQLDKLDTNWTRKLTGVDYLVISDMHWLFRINYLYENGNLIGCTYCNEPNIRAYDIDFVVERMVRLVLNHINDCEECNEGLVTLLRTFSPAHFEYGSWNNGGKCNRTRPYRGGEINLESQDWKLRGTQVKELESIRKAVKKGKRFDILDISRAMLMRPDGHPDVYSGNEWMKGYSDCVHWCMPGPVDVWNDFLMSVLKRYADFSRLREINQ